MNCSALFVIRDKHKILKKLKKNIILIDDSNNIIYSECENKKINGKEFCKKHISYINPIVSNLRRLPNSDINIEKEEDLIKILKLENIRSDNKYLIKISGKLKSKAENIKLFLQNQKRISNRIERPIEKEISKGIEKGIKKGIEKEIGDSSEDDYDSGSKDSVEEDEDEDEECDEIILNNESFFINRSLQIIKLDEEGLGYVAGYLEERKKHTNKTIKYLDKIYYPILN